MTATKKIIDISQQYLEGPSSRGKELRFALKVMWQLIKGFRALHFVGPCITVFGSARTPKDHLDYKMGVQIGKLISNAGLAVMTGGGPGIMEAANKGAYENGGISIGCTIKLPHEQVNNAYMTKYVDLDYFFVRKVLLLKYSYAFIVLPGGFGTLDELFETLTLIQTAIISNFPVVVMGSKFYEPIIALIDQLDDSEAISPDDRDLILFTDNADEAIQHISNYISQNYKVKNKKLKPLWWLGE